MMMMTTTVIMLIMISTMMIMVNTMISKKSFNDREKSSPFECGFDPKSSPRLPFSLQFFLIAMIFLVFDVELTLLFPLVTTMKISNIMNYYMLYLLFSLILLIGIYHEWNQGALNWIY